MKETFVAVGTVSVVKSVFTSQRPNVLFKMFSVLLEEGANPATAPELCVAASDSELMDI